MIQMNLPKFSVRKEMQISDNAIDKIERIFEIARKDSDFGSGRFVRMLI